MNPYLCALLLFALGIAPVRLTAAARVGRRTGYRLVLSLAGVPLLSRRVRFDPLRGRLLLDRRWGFARRSEERSAPEALRGARTEYAALLLAPPFRRALSRALHVRRLRLEALIALTDAKNTALCYAFLRAALMTLRRVRPARGAVSASLRVDFSGRGGSVSASGIIDARLGMLIYAAAVLAFLALRARRRAAKAARREEGYAASH